MKRFFATLFAVAVALVSLVGCNSTHTSTPTYITAKDGEWFEIQSITYSLTTNYTLTSKHSWETGDRENIDKDEYIDAIKDQENISLSGNIDINKECLIKKPEQYIGIYYYYDEYNYSNYLFYKTKLLSYNLYYVKIRFLGNDDIEINYCDYNADSYKGKNTNQTIRVKPLAYKITYFNN